jgi:hypothetical protein
LADLLVDDAAWDDFEHRYGRSLERSVPSAERQTLRRLAGKVRHGLVPDRSSAEGRLLAHLVAHDFDPEYRSGLTWRYRLERVAGALRRGELVSYILRKIVDRRMDHRD